ncbi:MAG: hydantoinase B/oxoprolinase family protein [Betaproteobacteria bacterium]|nr:hydantoinase B/oxoprolinase family protein [Betaproteobacteria bacterium]
MGAPLDPVTASVVEHGLGSITDEMANVVVSTAYSPLVRDLYDFTVALCNVRGEMVVQGVGMAIHLGALPSAVDAILRKLGAQLQPGDCAIMNDAYEGGMHLPNVILLTPCYAESDLLGYALTMAHHTDVGGHVPGSVPVNSRDIFGEGLRIPPMLLVRNGVRNDTLLALIEHNVRVPRDFFGDLESQVSACRTAEKRLQALSQRYGSHTILAVMEGLLDRSEKMARAEIAALPDGEYSFEDHLDNDGMDGPPQRLSVTIRIEGDELTADFTGTAAQVPTAINSPLAYSRSAFYLAVRSIMSAELPNTAGFFRPLHMIAPEGTIINPKFPSAVGAMGISGYRLADTIFGALAKAAPHAVRAASEGGTTRYTFAATVDGKSSIFSEALVGAWGGHAALDGIDGVANIAANMANSPIEMVESTYPVMVEEYAYEPNSEGAGARRGGLGVRRRVRILAEQGGILQIRSGRAKQAPWGTAGGHPGSTCQNVLDPGTSQERRLKGLETIHVPAGTVYLHVTPGAGGNGAPGERDPQLVARDVRDGKVSVERACDVYRVAVSPEGVIDYQATDALRQDGPC